MAGKDNDRNRRRGQEPRAHRNLSDVSDGGAPQSANASGDGAAGTGRPSPRGGPAKDEIEARASNLGYGKGNTTASGRRATARQRAGTGSASLHGGHDTAHRNVRDEDEVTQPRELSEPRSASRRADSPRQKRSLLSRLNPFSRDPR